MAPEETNPDPEKRIARLQVDLEHLIHQLQAENVAPQTRSRPLSLSITHLEEAAHWLKDHWYWLHTSH